MKIGKKDIDLFLAGAEDLGIEIEISQLEKIYRYLEELCRWNEKMNLIKFGTASELLVRHILDALVVVLVLEGVGTLVDVGTGAGLPGIPVKILRPDVTVIMVDGRRKKISFVEHAIRALGLKGVEGIWGRVGDGAVLARFRDGKADGMVSRAAMREEMLLDSAEGIVRGGGKIVAMKGRVSVEDVDRMGEIAGREGRKIEKIFEYHLPGTVNERNLIVFQ